MRNLFAFIAGGLFGAGLFTSGMTDTSKVQGWLDVFGQWDPTLAFVLTGAIVPMFFAWQITKGRRPALGGVFPPKPAAVVDRNLVMGSVLFGAGWGLAGLCPGPSIASLSYGGLGNLLFVGAMLGGMAMVPAIRSWLERPVPAE